MSLPGGGNRRSDSLPQARNLILGYCLFLSSLLGCESDLEKHSPASSPAKTDVSEKPTVAASVQQERPQESQPAGPIAKFVDISSDCGIEFTRFDDIRGLHRIHESTGGGVAIFDYDLDGWPDVLLTDGCKLPRRPEDEPRYSQLFRNLGSNRFAAVTSPSFFDCSGYGQGVAIGDFNSDGFDDMYVAAYGKNTLWQNNGDGTFSDVTDVAGADDKRWSTSAAFADFNADGHLDLYVVNYVHAPDDPPTLCPAKGSPDGYQQCPPTVFPAVDDRLLLNDGSGQFSDRTKESGIQGVDGKGLSLVVFHADEDGRPDIFVANDGTPNFFYKNTPNGGDSSGSAANGPHFEEQGLLAGLALNFEGKAEACMGIACGDYDQDGYSDLLVTNFFAETNTLYRNLAGKGFEDATNRSRLGPPSRAMLGFGTEFIDFDNDSWLDLVIANGHIDDQTWANPEESYRMPPQLFRNERNGRFVEISSWSGEFFQTELLGRGLAVGDLDNDGDQDFVISNQLAPASVVENQTPDTAKSVMLRLIGRESNRSAINCRVIARWPDQQVTREVVGGGSFQASSDRRIHIGLDGRDSIPILECHWSSGRVDTWSDVPAGFHTAVEGQELTAKETEPSLQPKGS